MVALLEKLMGYMLTVVGVFVFLLALLCYYSRHLFLVREFSLFVPAVIGLVGLFGIFASVTNMSSDLRVDYASAERRFRRIVSRVERAYRSGREALKRYLPLLFVESRGLRNSFRNSLNKYRGRITSSFLNGVLMLNALVSLLISLFMFLINASTIAGSRELSLALLLLLLFNSIVYGFVGAFFVVTK